MSGDKIERVEGKSIPAPENSLEVALSLARAGWPVFPVILVPVTKTDPTTGKITKAVDKRPLLPWLDGATTDPETIAKWYSIGVEHKGGKTTHAAVCWVGVHAQRAGIVIVDVDRDKGDGRDGKGNLKAAGIKLPPTLRYKTRSGGSHHVYRAPAERRLTIGRDVPVNGVDIRAGHGLMVYYGPPLDGKPELAPAPEWACLDYGSAKSGGSGGERAADGDIEAWLDRAQGGKPAKPLKRLVRDTEWPDLKHDDMLASVSELIKYGNEPGARTAYAEARDSYLEGRPDRARDWDNAAKGSIGKHGLPALTFELTKHERKSIAQRNKPQAIEEAKAERKAEWRIAKHKEAMTSDEPEPGSRVLEDGPLAVELAAAMKGRWAYTEAMGLLHYEGHRWVKSEPHDLIEEVRQRLSRIEVDEHTLAVQRGDNKGIDKARTLLSRNRARAVADLVIGRLALNKTKPDAHPHLLNTPSGVVDLRTKTLMPHDPALMFTKITEVGYDPDADMSRWEKALEALPSKVRPWLQVRMGQGITGFTPDDDKLVIFEGSGENGKTTILLAPRKSLGDYATTVPDRLLMANPGDHPTELTELMGVRTAIVEELPEGRNLNVKRLKDVVGTPFITARRMRSDNVTWASTHCLFLSTNYLPVVAETDHGTWRRLVLVRFPFKFVTRDKIKSDRDRLADPKIKRHFEHKADAGVLRWLVEGAAAWYANGQVMPDEPKRVERDTAAWRMDADPVMSYAADRLVLAPGYAITTDDLANDFNDYIERKGHRTWSAQTINSRFEGHVSLAGVERRQVRFGRIIPSRPPITSMLGAKPVPPATKAWVGLRFKTDDSVPLSADEQELNERMRA